MGKMSENLLLELREYYIPNRVILASEYSDPVFPILTGKSPANPPAMYLCCNNTCQLPVFSVTDLISLINKASGA
jgi:uncharacterized protein YyaL (SSP411 family)